MKLLRNLSASPDVARPAPYTVRLALDGSTVFEDLNRDTCIRFITGFDKASETYVDIRLYDTRGVEDLWHDN
jgi:hypothetical protein